MNEEIKKLKRAVIKEELIAITGNFIDAVILNQFIYWSERVKDFDEYIKQENDRAKKCGQNPQDLTGGWIYKTADDMSSETMIGLSASNMRLHIKALEKAGFISERTNPKYKWDRTKQYRVNLNEIVSALTEKGYTLDGYQHYHIENATHDLKNQKTDLDTQSTDIDAQTSQTKTAIPETTTETTAETTPIKKERKNTYEITIDNYTQNQDVKDAIIEYIKMRKLIKAPMTDRALTTLLNKLSGLAKTDNEKIAILNQAIEHSWKSVYPLEKQKPQQKQEEEKHYVTIDELAGEAEVTQYL